LRTTVSLVTCQDYQEKAVHEKIKEAIDLLGNIDRYVSPGEKVLLKPNLCIGRPPEKCVNTHPLVVKSIARLVQEAGATPLIGDSPMLGPARNAADKSGIGDVARELGVDLVEFEPIPVLNPEGKIFKTFTIGKIVKEVDKVINLPKLKTHALLLLTLGVKNMYGCIPGTRKAQGHVKTFKAGKEYFVQMILDLTVLVKPVLTIVDGVMAMEGMGPGFGDPRHLGLFIAGTDCVAVDRVIAEIVKVTPEQDPLLRVAIKKGYGVGQLQDIAVVGETIQDVSVNDFKLPPKEDMFDRIPAGLKRILKRHLTDQPVINQEKCEACEMCLKACPVDNVDLEDGTLKIDERACIQCLCCVEVCPHGAIDLVPGRLLKLYSTVRKLFGGG
jgi:uncharacterized protein (DUF362 family)/Pyruvate/2-oxoacid:ferredoxin oxidoreductase delta subunit